jgi:hypothetical protein
MAHDIKKTTYDWQPVEVDGKLIGLSLRKETRTQRVSEDGKVLDRGWSKADIEELAEIPIGKVTLLISEAVDWMVWFAQHKDEEN